MSRIATGNWDAVIVTHSSFEKIPVARGTQEEFFKEQLRELALAIQEQRKEGDSRIVKALERAKKQLDDKLKEATTRHLRLSLLYQRTCGRMARAFRKPTHQSQAGCPALYACKCPAVRVHSTCAEQAHTFH
jgi:hypothetical protein